MMCNIAIMSTMLKYVQHKTCNKYAEHEIYLTLDGMFCFIPTRYDRAVGTLTKQIY